MNNTTMMTDDSHDSKKTKDSRVVMEEEEDSSRISAAPANIMSSDDQPTTSATATTSSPKRASKHVAFHMDDNDDDVGGGGGGGVSNPQDDTTISSSSSNTYNIITTTENNGRQGENQNHNTTTTSSPSRLTKTKGVAESHNNRRNNLRNNRKKKVPVVDNTHKWKHRKRGRLVRVVSVEDNDDDATMLASASTINDTNKNDNKIENINFPPLPSNQYITALRRRAVRKLEDKPETATATATATTTTTTTNNKVENNQHVVMDEKDYESKNGEEQDDDYVEEEEYGDISLGMKLTAVGGRIIVQALNSLSDGRASPAQLVGKIKRGDVLLAIGNLSLVTLPVDQLMGGLKPLSEPISADGKYQRILHLRFEIGVGLELLDTHEKNLQSQTIKNVEGEMFSLFPMVDQLSGAPLFPPEHEVAITTTTKTSTPSSMSRPLSPNATTRKAAAEGGKQRDGTILVGVAERTESDGPDTIVSAVISKEYNYERELYTSEFFNWKQNLTVLLKQKAQDDATATSTSTPIGMTPSDRIEMGKGIMNLTKSLAIRMEDIDKGKDMRSFKTWSSNFSLRSGASARRRHILDSASLRSHRPEPIEPSDDDSDEEGSQDSAGSLEGVDGDALLLGLAAHDGIWRKQVIDALHQAIEEMNADIIAEEKNETKDEEDAANTEVGGAAATAGDLSSLQVPDIDRALTKELGTFLFGENISRIITKKKKSHALPPEEITTVLFDLTTYIATSAPDEITVFGGGSLNPSFTSGFGTFAGGKQKAAQKAEMLLANRFVLDEALPVWLLAFKPFPLDQRRVLWPRVLTTDNEGGGVGGATTILSDGDSLTVESMGDGPKSPGRVKNLREIIEDQNLDIETRAETCFLVTYYFKQDILIQYSDLPQGERKPLDEKVTIFVNRYGAYLQIHSCLSFSATVRAQVAITEILKAASHDLTHRDAVKEIKRGKSLTFYEAHKLSAVLTFLVPIRYEPKEEKRKFIRNLCVSAYPDIQPWQVRSACLDVPEDSDGESRQPCTPESMRELYYGYLSLLLDPIEGHDTARHDSDLVKEWCTFSLGFDSNGEVVNIDGIRPEHKKNFLSVASRLSSSHLAYKRDLVMLLDFSMKIGERDLALDLLGEILDNRKLVCNQQIPRRVLVCLRHLGLEALRLAKNTTTEKTGFNALKRVLLLFQRMSNNVIQTCRQSIVVSEEIHTLLVEWDRILEQENRDSQILVLIDFLVKESPPRDVLSSLVLWSSSRDVGDLLYSRIDALLHRGVERALRQELSGSLLRLKHAREGFTDENRVVLGPVLKIANKAETSIWRKLSVGSLAIDK